MAFIKGSEKPDEIIVLSAHLDHVGTDKDGATKYSYQSKAAQSCVRAQKTEAAKKLAEADSILEETEDIATWKELKAEAKELLDSKCELPEGLETFETAEECVS